MKRGFVTIATGNKYYYQLAYNLLMSYRLNSKDPLPFAILAEKENEYTSFFDDVVIIENPYRTFMDKLWLLKICPYDENIFIDADSLAFGDLNEYWTLFKDASDFSAIGGNLPLHDDGGQYDIEGIWKYKDLITYKTWVHAGVMFIRNSNSLEKFYSDCLDIISNYDKLHIARYPGSVDEATFGIAMPMNNFKTVPEIGDIFTFLPNLVKIKGNIVKQKLSYKTFWGKEIKTDCCLVHFTTRGTYQAFYVYQACKLNKILKGDTATIKDRVKSTPPYCILLKIRDLHKTSQKEWFGCRPILRWIKNKLNRCFDTTKINH